MTLVQTKTFDIDGHITPNLRLSVKSEFDRPGFSFILMSNSFDGANTPELEEEILRRK